jgi:hypothetical protein
MADRRAEREELLDLLGGLAAQFEVAAVHFAMELALARQEPAELERALRLVSELRSHEAGILEVEPQPPALTPEGVGRCGRLLCRLLLCRLGRRRSPGDGLGSEPQLQADPAQAPRATSSLAELFEPLLQMLRQRHALLRALGRLLSGQRPSERDRC